MTNITKKKQSTELVIPNDAPTGFEDVDMSSLIVPRFRLLQALSESCTDGAGKPGEFENSLTGEIFDRSIDVVLLSAKNGAVYLNNKDGLKCKSEDGITNLNGESCKDCPYNEYWGETKWKNNEPPKCAGTIDYVLVKRDTLKDEMPQVMICTFMKTSYKIGKKVLSMARFTGKPLYASVFTFASKQDKNDKGTFYNFNIKRNGWIETAEVETVINLSKTFSLKKIKVSEEVAHESDSESEGDDI